jgi:quinol-cytochrome oxidoreductase complex cytochrome b subunit
VTLDEWRSLHGSDLEQAMLAARWYVQPNDLIGGWAITVTDELPSAGYPEVADFLSEPAARHIVELHNAAIGR